MTPNGYNAIAGGSGAPRSPETGRKISRAYKPRIWTAEDSKRHSEALKGRVVSEETRRKISLAHTGKKRGPRKVKRVFSVQARANIAAALKLRKRDEVQIALAIKNLTAYNKSVEGRKRMSESRKGRKVPRDAVERSAKARRKFITLRSPSGELVSGLGVVSFIKEHGLQRKETYQVLNGTLEQHKGWTLP